MEKSKKKGAPLGNEFWKLVKNPTGRPTTYTPATLWKKACKYFEWVGKNPIKIKKSLSTGARVTTEKPRPMTEIAFCLFAGIDQSTFYRYKTAEEHKDFCKVCEAISQIIYSQKFEGAAVDLFNASIIARDLGLVDKKKLDIDWENMSDDQLNKVVDLIIKRKDNE